MKRLALVLLLFSAPLSAASIALDNMSATLQLVTATDAHIHYAGTYSDLSSIDSSVAGFQGGITSATTTTILAAPPGSTVRAIQWLTLRNAGSDSQSVGLRINRMGSNYNIATGVTIPAGGSLTLDQTGNLTVIQANGLRRATFPKLDNGMRGRWYEIIKGDALVNDPGWGGGGNSFENWAIFDQQQYGLYPAKALVGISPGYNGLMTDCSVQSSANPLGADQMGAPRLYTSGGDLSIRNVRMVGPYSDASNHALIDVLWLAEANGGNAGLEPITFPVGGLPPRDVNGASDGDGLLIGIFCSTGTCGASCSCNANPAIVYTNSDGVGGRAGNLRVNTNTEWGLVVPGKLQAGDRGIRSIQSINYATFPFGRNWLVIYRTVALGHSGYADHTSMPRSSNRLAIPEPGVRIWPGSCLWSGYGKAFPASLTNGTSDNNHSASWGAVFQLVEQ